MVDPVETGFGDYTCQDLGFAGGTLACLPSCAGFDTSQCSACTPSPSVIRCGPVIPSAMAFDATDLAATENEIALVGIRHDPMGQAASLSFALFSPELDVISVAPVPESAIDQSSDVASEYAGSVVVAPLPSGWVLAGSSDLGFFPDALDGSGQPIAHTTFGQLPTTQDPVYGPLLAARPNGGPSWSGSTPQVSTPRWFRTMELASARGSTSRSGTTTLTCYRAAFVADGFYVLTGNLLPPLPPGRLPVAMIQLAHISIDGELLGVESALQDVSGCASIVKGADDLRVAYWTGSVQAGSLELVLQSLDPTTDAAGAALGRPH
jgi:hypothetical protein